MAIPGLQGRPAGARARGLAETAGGGPGRESLCKARAAGRKARFETAHIVAKAPDMNPAFCPQSLGKPRRSLAKRNKHTRMAIQACACPLPAQGGPAGRNPRAIKRLPRYDFSNTLRKIITITQVMFPLPALWPGRDRPAPTLITT